MEGSQMANNKHTLPHDSSKNDHHLDVYSDREGKDTPEKYHEIIDGPKVKPNSLEGLRQRLKSQKGY
jgi:hypothetical protein